MKWKETPREKKAADETIRDSKGKFIRGHTPLGVRDKTTGKFIKATTKVKQQPKE